MTCPDRRLSFLLFSSFRHGALWRRAWITVIILLSITSLARAQIQAQLLSSMIEAAKSGCLSGTSKDDAVGIELSAFLDRLKGVAAKLGATFTSTQVEGAISIKEAEAKIKENDNIRSCMEKAGIFDYIRRSGERRPIILLIDNNAISYESNPPAPPGINSRVRIREGLAGRFGAPAPVFEELGIYWGWRRSQEIIDKNPDVVVMHFSAFGEDQDGKRCDPDLGGENRCSTDVVRMLMDVKRAVPKPVAFVIYSRKSICGVEYRAALVRRAPSDLRKDISLLPMGEYAPRGFADNDAIRQVELAVKDGLAAQHTYGRNLGDRGCALNLTNAEEKQVYSKLRSFKAAP